jgi:hypothetical protein
MLPALDLDRARDRLRWRLVALESRLGADAGDDAVWREYLAALDLFLRLEDRLARQAGNGRATLTTKEMADRLGISVKTLLARKKRGAIRPSIAHGKALGWRLEDAFR